jgi:hypothetical protein
MQKKNGLGSAPILGSPSPRIRHWSCSDDVFHVMAGIDLPLNFHPVGIRADSP